MTASSVVLPNGIPMKFVKKRARRAAVEVPCPEHVCKETAWKPDLRHHDAIRTRRGSALSCRVLPALALFMWLALQVTMACSGRAMPGHTTDGFPGMKYACARQSAAATCERQTWPTLHVPAATGSRCHLATVMAVAALIPSPLPT